MTKHSDFAEHV